MRLVALTGSAGAGKDTAAAALVAAGWERVAFADRMREALLALDPWVDDEHYEDVGIERLSVLVDRVGWDRAKREHYEIRRLLQRFGTEAGREIHGEDCWVNALFRDLDPDGSYVVADCRFDNEARAVIDRGGFVLRIIRPGVEPLPGGHSSEAGVSEFLIAETIRNDGGIDDLHRLMWQVVGHGRTAVLA